MTQTARDKRIKLVDAVKIIERLGLIAQVQSLKDDPREVVFLKAQKFNPLGPAEMFSVMVFEDGSIFADSFDAVVSNYHEEMACLTRYRTGETSQADDQVPTADQMAGMAWYNSMTDAQRAAWLKRVGTGVPAHAWQEFKRAGGRA